MTTHRISQPLLEGWLQDVAETATEVLHALLAVEILDHADEDKRTELLGSLTAAYDALVAYRQSCEDYREPEYQSETDPGPSQEQRL